MKAVTLVAAAAGVVGSVSAGSVRAHVHEHLHKRDTTSSTAWPEWDPATTAAAVSSASSSTSTTSWADWDPAATSSSSSTTSWSDWDPAATSSSSTTSWSDWDPATTTTTTTTVWSDWDSAAATATSVTSWSDWDPSTTTTTYLTTVWPDQDSATVTSTSTSTLWGTWDPANSTASAVAAAATTAWSEWDPEVCSSGGVVVSITGAGTWVPDEATSTSTIYSTSTITVEPTGAASTTWAEWDPSTSTTSSSSSTWAEWTSSSAVATATGSTTLGSYSGNTWAMTYSPYTSSGGCKDAGTVASDIATIAGKGFTTIRVYSTDCSTLENVGTAAAAHGLKIILGVFISATGISGAEGQVWDIVKWAQWDLVELIVVGNEAVFNGYCSAGALAGFVASAKGSFAAAGYTGPVTTTEPIETWLTSGSTFCSVVDVVAANLYAFFNADTTADQAGPFIQAEITELESICSGKDVYVMETGWPHAGNCNGVACPGDSEQATAITSIQSIVGAKVVFFSFEDDAWKSPGQFNVEQYWGCADVFSGN